jgi:hypothetical protein
MAWVEAIPAVLEALETYAGPLVAEYAPEWIPSFAEGMGYAGAGYEMYKEAEPYLKTIKNVVGDIAPSQDELMRMVTGAPKSAPKNAPRGYGPVGKVRKPGFVGGKPSKSYRKRKLTDMFKAIKPPDGGGDPPAQSAKKKMKLYYGGNYHYGGRFRRPRYKKSSIYSKQGAMLKVDSGGTIAGTATATTYIGHSTCASKKVFIAACMALVRALARRAGITFTSFDEEIFRHWDGTTYSDRGRIRVEYEIYDATGKAAGESFVYQIADSENWGSLAVGLQSAFETPIAGTSADDIHSIKFRSMTWEGATNDATTSAFVQPIARLDLDRCMVKLSMTSSLRLQNRTLAEAHGGASADAHESVHHVENNPLCGRVYEVDGINGLRTRKMIDGDNNFELDASTTTGMILDHSNNTTLYTEAQERLHPPPVKEMWAGRVKSSYVKLGPGVIKTSFLKKTTKIGFNKLVHKLKFYIMNGAHRLAWLGNCRVYALEKMMHVNANDPAISIGYEIHNFYGAHCSFYSTKAHAEHDSEALVTTAAPA